MTTEQMPQTVWRCMMKQGTSLNSTMMTSSWNINRRTTMDLLMLAKVSQYAEYTRDNV